jgi:hypothetical protein
LDSNAIWNFPLQEAAKKSWWYRRKKNWTIKDLLALKSLPGMDTLFITTGNFDFTPMPQKEKEPWGRSSGQNLKSIPWEQRRSKHAANASLDRLDLNQADSTALVAVRGIGPWSAGAIVEERDGAIFPPFLNCERSDPLTPVGKRNGTVCFMLFPAHLNFF